METSSSKYLILLAQQRVVPASPHELQYKACT